MSEADFNAVGAFILALPVALCGWFYVKMRREESAARAPADRATANRQEG